MNPALPPHASGEEPAEDYKVMTLTQISKLKVQDRIVWPPTQSHGTITEISKHSITIKFNDGGFAWVNPNDMTSYELVYSKPVEKIS